jgi:predicted MPP superfamily phosphohydrolase
MLPPVPLNESLLAFVVLAIAAAALLNVLLPAAWARRGVKIALAVVVVVMLAAHAAWHVGLRHYPTSYWGAAIASTGLVLFAPVVASLPFAAAFRTIATLLFLRAPPPAQSPSRLLSRRNLLEAATAAAPAAALSASASGFLTAAVSPRTPLIPLAFPNLHPDLDGFVILQLSDLHLGISRDVRDLESLLERLDHAAHRPDLIVFTGDVAEDLAQLAPALALADVFHPRAGVFASLGNHEYLRGIGQARAIFDKSRVPLLVGSGGVLRVGGARLWIGGADDPVATHGDIPPFLRATISRAMHGVPHDAFRMLLCHRPEGFDAAGCVAADLTLSGHTHGGQIGYNGKSAFEALWPDGYLWGPYRRREAWLYTTSGFGHWFPFRLGCPTEAPLLMLRRERLDQAPSV